MFDIKLSNGKRVLIIDLDDLSSRTHDWGRGVRSIFECVRVTHQIILVLVSPSLGLPALPKWMRDYVVMGILRPQKGDLGSYYIMELGPDQTWIKEG